MPRPRKARCIAQKPNCRRFRPESEDTGQSVLLTLDEFETVRWMDYESLTQENCAKRMGVSRTTVQRLYVSARQKIARMLVEGKVLDIEGGSVQILDRKEPVMVKGEGKMRIAIALDHDVVAMHFGRCMDFRLIDIEDGKVVRTENVHDEMSTHHERIPFLASKGVETLIVGAMGKGAYNRLLAAKIRCLSAAGKKADEALSEFLENRLNSELQPHECHGAHEDHGAGGHEHHHHGNHE